MGKRCWEGTGAGGEECPGLELDVPLFPASTATCFWLVQTRQDLGDLPLGSSRYTRSEGVPRKVKSRWTDRAPLNSREVLYKARRPRLFRADLMASPAAIVRVDKLMENRHGTIQWASLKEGTGINRIQEWVVDSARAPS